MLFRLALLFIVLPLVELALLLQIARLTDPLSTLALVIFTGILGAWLARREGTECWLRIQRELGQGQMPADSLVDGLMILIAGAVLITPGVLTDLFGFALLTPPIRAYLKSRVIERFRSRLVVLGTPPGAAGMNPSDDTIDVESRPRDGGHES